MITINSIVLGFKHNNKPVHIHIRDLEKIYEGFKDNLDYYCFNCRTYFKKFITLDEEKEVCCYCFSDKIEYKHTIRYYLENEGKDDLTETLEEHLNKIYVSDLFKRPSPIAQILHIAWISLVVCLIMYFLFTNLR